MNNYKFFPVLWKDDNISYPQGTFVNKAERIFTLKPISMKNFFKENEKDFEILSEPGIYRIEDFRIYYITSIFNAFIESFLMHEKSYYTFKTLNAITFESMYIYLNINSLFDLGITLPILNGKNFVIKDTKNSLSPINLFNWYFFQKKKALDVNKNILIENINLIKLNYSSTTNYKYVQGSIIFYNRDFIHNLKDDINTFDNTFDNIIYEIDYFNETKSYLFIEIKDYGKVINILE